MLKIVTRAFDKLTLSQQSLSLVLLLLAFECLFSLGLTFQLQSAKTELKREAYLNEVFRRSQSMVFALHDYLQALETYATTRSSLALSESSRCKQEISSQLQWLMSNLSSEPSLRQRSESLHRAFQKFFKVIDILEENIAELPKERLLPFFAAVLEKVNPVRTTLEKNSVRLLAEEEALLRQVPEKEAATRDQLRQIILGGLAVNILSVLCLTVFFVRRIGGRIDLIVDNTRRLARGEAMHSALEGTDELAQLDQAIHEMAQAIAEAQRERQEFLAMVSHELRTPLTSVQGSVELMSMGVFGSLPAPVTQAAELSLHDTGDLLILINDLLDLEKMESGKLTLDKTVLYLEDVLQQAVQSVRAEAEARGIVMEAPECNAEVTADEARLRQVFVNLLTNAVQYSPRGAGVRLAVTESADRVSVCVLDHGNGVPEPLRATLFDRFRRLDDTDAGIVRGMGLPICRHLVHLHDGDISYEPNPNGGSVFTVTLPLASAVRTP